MELLNSFSLVKTKPAKPSAYKKEVVDGLREVVDEVVFLFLAILQSRIKTTC
jgi:gluconate kinase